ncbi:MAG: hypothetical protein V7756_01765 [Halopseudomonas sp.]|uniref:hypothetical protein n=1 Tax=Halopseudomonas sp. TaxID=2901191 RepID=UPI0030025E55
MKRQELIDKIELQERQMSLRAEVVSVLSQHSQHLLRQIPSGWLVATGALLGGLAGRIGVTRAYTLGFTSMRLLPMAQHAFHLGRSIGARE